MIHLITQTATGRAIVTALLMLALSVGVASAQSVKVTGTVTDDKNVPMPGASVLEKGTLNGTVTDLDGNFSINVAPGTVLVFSSIGYVTVEQTASETMSIVLKEDSKLLDEVVVVGYGVQKKSDLTGAISSVKSEDLQNRSVPRAEQALQGKTAGVQLVNTSAKPGSSPTVRVRGFSSNGSSDPLYVVDGLRVSDLGSIDPNTIESIEVLKDAASAAIYGAQAGNGVILVTTKKGQQGTSSLTYEFQYSLTNLARKPKIINAQEAVQLMKESDLAVDDAYIKANYIDNGCWDGTSSTDWFDVAFNTGKIMRHSLGLQGANDKGQYFASLNWYDENGIVRGNCDTYQRLTGTVNGSYNIKPWLRVGTTNSFEKYKVRQITDGQGQANVYNSMIARVITLTPLMADTYSPDNLPEKMQQLLDNNMPLLTDENGNYYGCWLGGESIHPIVSTKTNKNESYGYNVLGTAYLDFMPVKGLTVTSKLGYRLSDSNTYNYQYKYYASGGSSNLTNNSVSRSNGTSVYYQWENYFNYHNTFAERHTLDVMGGMSYSDNDYTYLYGYASNVMKDDPLFQDISYAAGDATNSAAGSRTHSRKLSYYARVGYSYADRYFIQGIFRADAADTALLPAENRWGYFPGVSAGWNFTNENFFPELNWLDFGKIRFSWGQNGSTSNLGSYKYANSIIQTAKGYPYGSTSSTFLISGAPSQVSNPDLKWETSEQIDLGLDLRMLNSRLTLTADWYKKKTKDLIVTGTQLPLSVGNGAPPVNAGNVENTGVELEIGWRDNVGDFSYGINANIATLKNKVTYLDPSISDNRMYGGMGIGTLSNLTAFEVGHPIWYFYGYKVDHLLQESEIPDGNPDNLIAGSPVFKDMDGDGQITESDRTDIGKSIPDFTYGITLTASWRGLDFLLFGSGAYGNQVFSAIGYNSFTYNYKEIYDNRWTVDNPNGKYANPLTGSDTMNKYLTSDASVFNASYFKIKQIQLGYTLPKKLTHKFFVENLRFYVSLDDWFCFTPYHGLDPEVSATATSGMGIDYGNYPNTRKTLFGVNITF